MSGLGKLPPLKAESCIQILHPEWASQYAYGVIPAVVDVLVTRGFSGNESVFGKEAEVAF